MVTNASLDEIRAMEAALRVIEGKPPDQSRRFAHPNYVKALLERENEKRRSGGTKDLAPLSPKALDWSDVLANIAERLKAQAQKPDSLGTRACYALSKNKFLSM